MIVNEQGTSEIMYAGAQNQTYEENQMEQYDEFHAGYINENSQVHTIKCRFLFSVNKNKYVDLRLSLLEKQRMYHQQGKKMEINHLRYKHKITTVFV